jgi:hypothetical protein
LIFLDIPGFSVVVVGVVDLFVAANIREGQIDG